MAKGEKRPELGSAYWKLAAASGLSNLADGLFKMAVPLVAILFTRSPVLVAGLEAVRMVPWLIGALPIGALTDRVDRRRSMLWANAARAFLVTGAGLMLATDNGSMWLLYGAALAIGTAEVFYDTAAQSMLPSIVSRPQLDRANGKLFAIELGAQEFVGPPLAGIVVAVSASLVFFSSGAIWIVALGALLLIPGRFKPARIRTEASLWREISEGLRFIWHRPLLRTMAVMSAIATIALGAAFSVLVLFVVGSDSPMGLTSAAFGVLFAAMAAGGVIGSLLSDRIERRIGRSGALTIAVLSLAAAIGMPAVTASFWLIAGAQFVGGIGNMMWNVVVVSYRQRATPDALLGRVNSTYRLVTWGARPIGAFVGGAIAALVSIEAVYAIMGILALTLLIPNRRITEQALAAAELQ